MDCAGGQNGGPCAWSPTLPTRSSRLSTLAVRIARRHALWVAMVLRIDMSPRIDNSRFRNITPGVETLPCSFSSPRHRHLRGYSTIVLAGCFEEAGYHSRIRATAGDVLIHPALDCHGNQMVSAGVKLIRLDWHETSGIGGLYRLDDVDKTAQTAERNVITATDLLNSVLRERCKPSSGRRNDWPDLLQADLAKEASPGTGVWAEVKGLARGTGVSGICRSNTGSHPRSYRPNCGRVRRGCASREGPNACALLRQTQGFADQAHMTRWNPPHYGSPTRCVPSKRFRRTAYSVHRRSLVHRSSMFGCTSVLSFHTP
jgi:hypothetical protein